MAATPSGRQRKKSCRTTTPMPGRRLRESDRGRYGRPLSLTHSERLSERSVGQIKNTIRHPSSAPYKSHVPASKPAIPTPQQTASQPKPEPQKPRRKMSPQRVKANPWCFGKVICEINVGAATTIARWAPPSITRVARKSGKGGKLD